MGVAMVYCGLGSFKGFWQDIGLWWFFRDAWLCSCSTGRLATSAQIASLLLLAASPVRFGLSAARSRAAAVLGSCCD